jgi:hypothetical protein
VLESAHDPSGVGSLRDPARPAGRCHRRAGLLALPADALTQRASAGAPYILKPLPPEWFVDDGTNAEMRWDPVDPPLVPPYNTNGYFFDGVARHSVTLV